MEDDENFQLLNQQSVQSESQSPRAQKKEIRNSEKSQKSTKSQKFKQNSKKQRNQEHLLGENLRITQSTIKQNSSQAIKSFEKDHNGIKGGDNFIQKDDEEVGLLTFERKEFPQIIYTHESNNLHNMNIILSSQDNNQEGGAEKNEEFQNKSDDENKPRMSRRSDKSGKNIFDREKKKSGRPSKGGQPKQNQGVRNEMEGGEGDFEEKVLTIIKEGNWEELEMAAVDQLDASKGKSSQGFFYLGVSLYKMKFYSQAIKAFQKSIELDDSDGQAYYNLALAYFKQEQYNKAVENLKKCTEKDPDHFYAWNNLAFIYNMHQMYQEAIDTCHWAQEKHQGENTTCCRHWAFALYKKGQMSKAIVKIKQAIQYSPEDADNWIVWGLIMRTVGNYVSAKHKFERALKHDPENETAIFELEILDAVMKMDQLIRLDQVPEITKLRAKSSFQEAPDFRKNGVCSVLTESLCNLQ